MKAALKNAVEAFGTPGYGVQQRWCGTEEAGPIAEVDEDEWERILSVDLRGVFPCMKYEILLMLEHGGAAIVNTSSGAGIIGIKNNAAYTAAKHGVSGLTRATALEYAAKNVRINSVCPGYIDTPMIERFAGRTPEARAQVISEEPSKRMGPKNGAVLL